MPLSENELAFEEQYKAVFDENGNIRNCGRDACTKLIALASNCLSSLPFGNPTTGILEVDNLHHLYDMIMGIG